ncbi:MAG: sigma-70 family RNA polymerase sigma factor [Cyclobacteriaceae bacterium]
MSASYDEYSPNKMNLKDKVIIGQNISSIYTEMEAKKTHHYANKTDAEIWQSLNSGNDDALIFIYTNYVGRLLSFGLQFAPRELVKDAIQDLFLYLKNKKKSKDGVHRIAPYLYKALYRIIYTKLERSRKFMSREDKHDIMQWNINLSNEVMQIQLEHHQEQSKRLNKSLNELSEKQRQAILLYYFEGFTHQEITDIMGLKNKSSVRKLIYRAIDSLKEHFNE